MSTTADRNGIILLDWLRLLGWTVEIEREADHWVGLARHADAATPELRIGGCAAGLTALVWQLFMGAVERLDTPERMPLGVLQAA
ncbi:MAG: hypothetical protein V7644_2677 [Actinomycetota bacterium]